MERAFAWGVDLVKDHPHFMHGTSYHDEKGNNVRVLDIVPGKNLYVYVNSINPFMDAEDIDKEINRLYDDVNPRWSTMTRGRKNRTNKTYFLFRTDKDAFAFRMKWC